MSVLPVDIVRKFLENATDPAIITELVADDATYVSLNNDDAELQRIMPWAGTKHGLQAFQDNLRGVFAEVVDGKIVYFQFQEDTFATARTFRSGGTWTIWADPAGEPFEI